MDDQETDHVAQRKAAGIPHEKLMSTVGVTEHVVAPKGHKDTQRTDRQQGVNILPAKKEYHAQDRQGDTTQARGQAVDTINQVNGICYIYHDKHRERHPYPNRHRVNTEQATKRVEPVAWQYQQKRSGDLHGELIAVAYTDQIVANTHQIKQRHAHEQEQVLIKHIEWQARGVHIPKVQAEAYHKEHGHQDHRKKGQSTQTRNRHRMHLTGVRDIIEPFLMGNHQDPRDDHHAERYGKQETE